MSGERFDYVPDMGDVYIPDCDLPLNRSFWRVWQMPDGSAYMIPRPDGAPALAGPCSDESDPLFETLDAIGLCDPNCSSSQACIARVNSMTVEQALAISRFLHENLVFVFDDALGFSPYPFEEDVIAVCEQYMVSPGVVQYCDFHRARLAGGGDIGIIYEGEAAKELAVWVNDLYGIIPADEALNAPELSDLGEAYCDMEARCITWCSGESDSIRCQSPRRQAECRLDYPEWASDSQGASCTETKEAWIRCMGEASCDDVEAFLGAHPDDVEATTPCAMQYAAISCNDFEPLDEYGFD
jgi:hypothetical protein